MEKLSGFDLIHLEEFDHYAKVRGGFSVTGRGTTDHSAILPMGERKLKMWISEGRLIVDC